MNNRRQQPHAPAMIGDSIRSTRRLVPDSPSQAELPPIREAFLSPRSLDTLFSDLAQHAENVRLTMSASSATPVALTTAHERLAAGDITKLQVRYDWENAHWIDTLERRGSGFRLVRIEHQLRT